MNVVCRSFETYIGCASRSTSSSARPGVVAAARCIAARIASLFVASPLVWKTTTFGGRTPVPNACSVRWFAS